MTQPTAGFGQTAPSPRRASASAARIASRSRRRSLAESPRVSIAIGSDPPDETPDHIARDIGLARALQLTHQRVNDPFYPFRLERALSQGDVDRSGEFVAVEWFTVSIFLNHGQ